MSKATRMSALFVLIVLALGVAYWWWQKAPIERDHSQDQAMERARFSDPIQHDAQARAGEIKLRFRQAVVMLHAKQFDHAVTALHRVLKLAPVMPEAHVNMGYALFGQLRYAEARAFFESAIALRPAQANAYYGLALCLDALNDRSHALGAMRTFLHLTRSDDAYSRKARSAIWEWETQLNQAGAQQEQPFSGLGKP